MRGSFTSKIEIIPTIVSSKEDKMIIEKVQPAVRQSSLEFLRLLSATIAVKKTKGRTIYLPILINKSDRKEIKLKKAALSVGKRNAASTPRATPIRYFIHTFIKMSISYSGLTFQSVI